MAISDRIRQARRRKKLSQGKLAEKLGLTRASVSHWEKGETEPKAENARALCALLDIEYHWLLEGDTTSISSGLPLRGEVRTGSWIEPSTGPKVRRIPIAPDPDYPVEAQFALVLRDESANRIAPEGAFLHCVDAELAGLSIRSEDIVIVERMDNGRVETTVRRARRMNGGWDLLPETDDLRWQDNFHVAEADPNSARIKAVVIGAYGAIQRGR